jgi:hypothetical protein
MAKVTDTGSVPKDSPLFSGDWFFSSTRLSDVVIKKPRQEGAEKSEAEATPTKEEKLHGDNVEVDDDVGKED